MRPLGRSLLAMVLAGTVGCSSSDPVPTEEPPPPHPAVRRARVAVADAVSGGLTIVDAEFGEVRASLTLPGAATRLQPSFSGNLGAATTADGVSFFSSGVSVVDHTGEGWEGNEHIHVYKFAPQLLSFSLGPEASVSSYGPRWAALVPASAGMSDALSFEEGPLIQNDMPPLVTTQLEATGGPVLPLDDGGLLAAVVDPQSGPGIARISATGQLLVVDSGCTAPTAMTRHGQTAVATCAEGWGLLEPAGDDQLEVEVVPYAHGSDAPSELVEHIDAAWVGAREANTWSWVDLAARTSGQAELPAGACDVVYEDETGEGLWVLTDGGQLHEVEAASGAALREPVSVTTAFDCDAAVRPRLAAAPRLVFVSLPTEGSLLELDATTLTERQRYELGGAPSLVTVLGVDPTNRNAGYCATCQ